MVPVEAWGGKWPSAAVFISTDVVRATFVTAGAAMKRYTLKQQPVTYQKRNQAHARKEEQKQMSMNQMPIAFIASPTPTEEETSYQEISHVFYCMMCDFQAQTDTAVTSHKGAPPGQDEIVQARLFSQSRLGTKGAPAEAMGQTRNKT